MFIRMVREKKDFETSTFRDFEFLLCQILVTNMFLFVVLVLMCFGFFYRAPNCDGSSYVEQGNTKVLVSVVGPHEVTLRSRQSNDEAFVNCEVSLAPFASGERKKRTKGDRYEYFFLSSLFAFFGTNYLESKSQTTE
jgi:hypothetical protein